MFGLLGVHARYSYKGGSDTTLKIKEMEVGLMYSHVIRLVPVVRVLSLSKNGPWAHLYDYRWPLESNRQILPYLLAYHIYLSLQKLANENWGSCLCRSWFLCQNRSIEMLKQLLEAILPSGHMQQGWSLLFSFTCSHGCSGFTSPTTTAKLAEDFGWGAMTLKQ